VSLYRRSSEQKCMCLWWVSTGEAAGGQEKVNGARVGVAYTWVVHGHANSTEDANFNREAPEVTKHKNRLIR
jgi:hypothetical protein